MSAIAARGIRAGYDAGEVLRDVDVEVRGGEVVALVGPNGAGKSTLLRILAGLLPPSAGRVQVDDHDLASLDRRAIARRIAVVPQVFETLFPFTVREIVALGRTARLGALARLGPGDARAVDHALRELDLLALADRRIDRISGGERQRAVLAMALAQETGVLLLDEPTAHLDPAHQRGTLAHVARIARDRGLAVIAVLHDLNLAAALADRILVLDRGSVIRDGAPLEVITGRLVRDVFGPGLDVVLHDGVPYVLPASSPTAAARVSA